MNLNTVLADFTNDLVFRIVQNSTFGHHAVLSGAFVVETEFSRNGQMNTGKILRVEDGGIPLSHEYFKPNSSEEMMIDDVLENGIQSSDLYLYAELRPDVNKTSFQDLRGFQGA